MSGVTIEVPWEDDLKAGPVGEYVEVVDIDPGSDAAYAPVDLNSPALLGHRWSGALGSQIRVFTSRCATRWR